MPVTRDRPLLRCLLRPVALLLFALLVRGGVLVTQAKNLSGDPDGYRALAGNLLRLGVFGHGQQPTAYRPPLYPLLLTACLAGPWQPQAAIALLHLGLGLATVWLTYAVGRRWQLGAFAYVAGILVVCDPILMHQSTLVMTETLATFLAIVSLCLVTAAARPSVIGHETLPVAGAEPKRCPGHSGTGASLRLCPSHRLSFELRRGRVLLLALTGMSYAIAALCRPTFLLSLVFTAAALAWTRPSWPQRAQVVAAMGFGASLILFPWAARNEAVLGKPVVTTTHGGYTLLLGNNGDYYHFLSTSPWRSVWRSDRLDDSLRAARSADEFANDRREYALAWQTIREQPGMFLYASLRRLGALWGLLPHRLDINESLSIRASRYATAIWYFIVFGLALTALGSGAVRATAPPWLWATMLVASFTATHVVYWSDLRMRAPLVPAIALLAAAGAKRLFSSRGKVFNLVR